MSTKHNDIFISTVYLQENNCLKAVRITDLPANILVIIFHTSRLYPCSTMKEIFLKIFNDSYDENEKITILFQLRVI